MSMVSDQIIFIIWVLTLLTLLVPTRSISIEEEFRVLQEMGTNLNDPKGGRLLSVEAAENGLFEHVKVLLHSFKVDVNKKSQDGWTVLTKALWMGHDSIAEMVLEAGANPRLGNREGTTPLMIACKLGSTSSARRILEKDAKTILAVDVKGYRPLMYAAESGEIAIIELLLQHSHEMINARSKREGMTALLLAVSKSHWAAAKALIEHGVDVDLQSHNRRSYSALHFAAEAGNAPIVEALLDHGATVDTFAKPNNLTPLFLATKSVGNLDTLLALIKAGADVNHRHGEAPHLTVLMSAVVGKQKEMVLALLRQGRADPTITITQPGCDTTIRDCRMSAAKYARLLGHNDIREILEKAEEEWARHKKGTFA